MVSARHGVVGMVVGMVVALPAAVAGQTTPREIALAYEELTLNQRYDELLAAYAPDVVFWDPTADVFEGPVGAGPVRGAQAIVALERSWGVDAFDLDVRRSFTSGSVTVIQGTLGVRYGPAAPWIQLPFVTTLRVANGKVAERTDFAEYIESFGLGDDFDANTESTRDVAARYLKAYLDMDFEGQDALLHDDAEFEDPTVPRGGGLLKGRDVIVDRRRATFQSVSAFGLDVDESFVANHHAVFIGTTTYTLANGTPYAQPAVFVVEVKDGKVTRHWDFVDYTVGPVG